MRSWDCSSVSRGVEGGSEDWYCGARVGEERREPRRGRREVDAEGAGLVEEVEVLRDWSSSS